ncbi:MAG: glycosyltransferase family 2 protein [Patescibacteria group bacterium]
MKLSIIILNYNTQNLLRLCLQNLIALKLDFPYEIIVVDNASVDDSVDMMKEKFPQIKLIVSKINCGHARGNNLGIKQAQGEYILILNTDIIFKNSEDLSNLLKFMDQQSKVAIVGPRLLNGDGSVQRSCYRSYSLFTPIWRRTPLGKLKFAKRDLNNHLMNDFNHNETIVVEWILGACMLLRKKFIEKYGAFDEIFFLYFADYELCDRASANGYKVYYYHDTKIIHYHKRESAQKSIWGGFGSLFNYITRIHIKDWLKYLSKKRQLNKKK